jgi:hypothetical protein
VPLLNVSAVDVARWWFRTGRVVFVDPGAGLSGILCE